MGNHVKVRKEWKKMRRKRKRTARAQERDKKLQEEERRRAASPTYLVWVAEQQALELFRQEEEERIRKEQHKKWVEEEIAAQKRWREQQKRLERIRAERAKQELLIREEWEREQEKLLEEKRRIEKEKEDKEREHLELLQTIERFVEGEVDDLPETAKRNYETRPDEAICPFFAKVGACRFKDHCSRNHIRPGLSDTLLFPGFFSFFGMDKHRKNEYDTDISLEYEDCDTYQAFRDFYDDVLPELRSFGDVCQFKVCCNAEAHLKGNVYVQYLSERSALRAFRALQGRFYGGKQIMVEFCNIPYWSKAICGLFGKGRCPKGDICNFLHVFRNPTREFADTDNDYYFHQRECFARSESSSNWRWSPSPERYNSSRRSPYSERSTSSRSKRSGKDDSKHKSNRTEKKRQTEPNYTEKSRRKHNSSSSSNSTPRKHRDRSERSDVCSNSEEKKATSKRHKRSSQKASDSKYQHSSRSCSSERSVKKHKEG